MIIIYNKKQIEIKCVMCKGEAEYIAPETNEPLCEKCAITNEEIKKRDYPSKPKCREIQDSDIPLIIRELKRQGILE